MMEQHTKIKSWITIIALLALACSLVNICFYILVRFDIIEETLSIEDRKSNATDPRPS